jgi:hypothetical protein
MKSPQNIAGLEPALILIVMGTITITPPEEKIAPGDQVVGVVSSHVIQGLYMYLQDMLTTHRQLTTKMVAGGDANTLTTAKEELEWIDHHVHLIMEMLATMLAEFFHTNLAIHLVLKEKWQVVIPSSTPPEQAVLAVH